MDEYVSREDLIEEIEEEIEAENSFKDGEKLIIKGLKIALKDIKKLKATDVQPVKRGRWKYYKNNGIINTYICTNCQSKVEMTIDVEPSEFHYCPNCGARMDGDIND